MGSEWEKTTIFECASKESFSTQIGPFGNKIKSEIYTKNGAPVLRGVNVNSDSRFNDSDFVFIDQKLADKEFTKFTCKSGDVILCHKGTLGKIGIIPQKSNYPKYIMGNSMMKVRTDNEKLDSLYLFYWLSSDFGQDYIFSRVSQVGVPQIQRPLTTLREAELLIPPLPEQKAIAHILGSLDDKIELNRKMNATLEGMAQALFKSWFVDFDPVIDNALAAGNPIPDELTDRAEIRRQAIANGTANRETAKQFPAAFQLTEEMGWIPEGWEVKSMANLLRSVSDTYPLRTVNKVVFLNTGDILDGRFLHNDLSGTAGLPGQAKKSIRKNDILFSEIRPKNRRFAYVYFDSPQHVVSTKLMVLRATSDISSMFAYLILKQDSTIEYLQMMAESRSGTFPQITFDTLSKIEVPLPKELKLVAKFTESFLEPTFRKQLKNDSNSKELKNLCDTLLPKLISGELRVPNAEKLTEIILEKQGNYK